MTANTSVEVIPTDVFNVARLASAELPETFTGMLELLRESGITVEAASDVLADEWPEIDKAKLINVNFVLTTWQVSKPGESDTGNQYLVCRGITSDGKRFRFTDGSTGIMAQLVNLTRQRIKNGQATPNAGLHAVSGLTVSEYTFTDDKGKTQPAKTYYISGNE